MSNQKRRLIARGGRRKASPNGGIHYNRIATPLAVLRVNARQLKVALKAIKLDRAMKVTQATGAHSKEECPIPDMHKDESVIVRASANGTPLV